MGEGGAVAVVGIRNQAPTSDMWTVVSESRGMTDLEVHRFLTTGELPNDAPTRETVDEGEDLTEVLGEGDVLALLNNVPVSMTAAADSWKKQLRAPRGTPIGGQWVDSLGGIIKWKWRRGDSPLKSSQIYKQHGDDDVVTVRSDNRALMRWNADSKKYDVVERRPDGSWERTTSLSKKTAYDRAQGETGEEWFEPDVTPLSEGDREDDGFVESREVDDDDDDDVTDVVDTEPDSDGADEPLTDADRFDFSIASVEIAGNMGPAGMKAVGLVSDGSARNTNGRGDMSESTREALESYALSPDINRPLRSTLGNLDDLSDDDRSEVSALDAGFAQPNAGLDSDLITFRGVSNLVEVLGGLDTDVDLTGVEVQDNGFASTSLDKTIAQSFTELSGVDPAVMRVLVPKGTSAVGVLGIENEVLLPRGSRFRIVRDNGRDNDGVRRLDVMITTPSSTDWWSSPEGNQVLDEYRDRFHEEPPARPGTENVPTTVDTTQFTGHHISPNRSFPSPGSQARFSGSSVDIRQDLVQAGYTREQAERAQKVNDKLAERYGGSFPRITSMAEYRLDHPNVSDTAAAAVAPTADRQGLTLVVQGGIPDEMIADAHDHGEFAGSNLEGMLTHEAAHAILPHLPVVGDFYPAERVTIAGRNTLYDAVSSAYDAAIAAGMARGPSVAPVSAYARKNNIEAEGEIFTEYHWGGADREPWVIAWGEALHNALGLDPTPFSEDW